MKELRVTEVIPSQSSCAKYILSSAEENRRLQQSDSAASLYATNSYKLASVLPRQSHSWYTWLFRKSLVLQLDWLVLMWAPFEFLNLSRQLGACCQVSQHAMCSELLTSHGQFAYSGAAPWVRQIKWVFSSHVGFIAHVLLWQQTYIHLLENIPLQQRYIPETLSVETQRGYFFLKRQTLEDICHFWFD